MVGLIAWVFSWIGDGLVVGEAAELVDHFRGLSGQGVERFYVWFTDFAASHTLGGFGADVIGAMAE